MKDVVDALIASGENITEGELIAFILDGHGQKFDPTMVHIASKLDEGANGITLGDSKVILQRVKQRMSKYFAYGFEIHEGSLNMPNKVVEREFSHR